jgi:hypothetical protein
MQINDGVFGKQFNDNDCNKTWHRINVGNPWVTYEWKIKKKLFSSVFYFLTVSNQSYIYHYELICLITETKAHQ